MDKCSRVFFLGAGASADAGFPLTGTLLSEIRSEVESRLKKGVSDQDKKSLDRVIRFIQVSGLDKDESLSTIHQRPPIVDAIGLIDTCLREGRPLDRWLDIDGLRRLRDFLTVELARLFKRYGQKKGEKVKLPPGDTDTRKQPGATKLRLAPYYRDFAASLETRDRISAETAGDSIITTNYDINADLALFERVYDPSTDLDDVYLGAEFKDPDDGTPAFADPKHVVDLFKLHGSVNWLYCPRCSRIYVAAFGHSVQFLVDTKKNASERKCFCGYYSLEPVLIAPSVLQEIVNPHLVNIWLAAYEALESAQEWIFVGYSLPSEDLAIRSLLYRAIDGMSAVYVGRKPRVEVVCPPAYREKLASVYDSFFDPIPVTYTTQRFKDYVGGMAIRNDAGFVNNTGRKTGAGDHLGEGG